MARDKIASTDIRVEHELDALFRIAPAEFTNKRNDLASRLKKAGRREESDQVKALPKPPASAWAVNRVYHEHGPVFERLLQSGQLVREAQARQISTRDGQLKKALDEKRRALEAVAGLAAAALESEGHHASTEVMRRITATLEALSVSLPAEARLGRLTQDLDPPGFEVLAALLPALASTPPPVVGTSGTRPAKPDPKTQKSDGAKIRKQAAHAALSESEAALHVARERATTTGAQLEQLRQRRDELTKRLEHLRAEAAEMERRLLALKNTNDAARREVSAAEKTRARAAREVERLGKS